MKRALIVDDCPDTRMAIAATLRKHFEVDSLEAESGEAAVLIIRAFAIDLVVSDLMMPNGTGVWLHQILKEHFSKIPLIMFTAIDAQKSTLPTADETLKAVIKKPNMDELVVETRRLGVFCERKLAGS